MENYGGLQEQRRLQYTLRNPHAASEISLEILVGCMNTATQTTIELEALNTIPIADK